MTVLGCYVVNGFLQVFVTEDNGLLHMSIAHPHRYPTWDEIRDIRYQLLPDEKTFGILLPPRAQYVNIHPDCFHLHEIPQVHEEEKRIITL